MKPSDLELIAKKFGVSPGVRKCNQAGGPALRPVEPKCAPVVLLDSSAPRKEKGSTRFKVRFVVRSQRPLDPDNYRLKDLLDLCVLVGFLPDDSWRDIAEYSVSSEKVHSPEEEQTIVSIEAVSPLWAP